MKISKIKHHSALRRWYVHIDGKMKYLTKEDATKETAVINFAKLKEELRIKDEELPDNNNDRRFNSLIPDYLESVKHKGGVKYKKNRTRIIDKFLEEFGKSTPRNIREDQIENWTLDHWSDKPNMRLTVLKRLTEMFHWMQKTFKLTDNPVRDIERPKGQPRDASCVIELNEYETLIGSLQEPYKSICEVLWHTGARPDEILSAEACHYQPHVHCISRNVNKNSDEGKLRQILLNDRAELIIKEAIAKHPNGLLFPSLTRKKMSSSTLTSVIRRLAKKHNIKKRVMAYAFRHSFANRLFCKDVPIAKIAALMDDTIDMVAKHYLHSADKLHTMRNLLN